MGREGREPQVGPTAEETRALQACLAGDRAAYEWIVIRYSTRALGVARGILRDASLAEDAAQDAFVRAYRALSRFDLREPFYPWFYRILKNACLSALKRRPRRETSLDAPGLPTPPAPPSDPAALASRNETRARIDAALARVSEAHREILGLAHFDELSYKEIAACLGIPVGTVMSRLWAARQALRKVLAPDEA
ncbi:MAG: RNA polymerase sigma factor [Planctomycetaceae bacterium]